VAIKDNAEHEGYFVSRSAFWYLLNGKGRPRLHTVEAFVAACQRIARRHRPPIHLPAELVDPERWRALHAAVDPAPTRGVVPRQLPSAATLVARESELDELDRFLKDGAGSILIVTGMAGVGKTTLAVTWARRVADQFPDGQLYVNLRGFQPAGDPVPPEEALRIFLDALDVPLAKVPAELTRRTTLFRSLLDGRRMLVVLDNAYDAAQVRPLLPGSPGCLTLVTSRRDLAGLVAIEGARPLNVNVLNRDGALRLVRSRLGDCLADEPEAVDQLIAHCAGLPLALAVAAARASMGAATASTLDGLRMGDDVMADVRAVLSWSYRALAPPAASLFRLIGLHPGPELDTEAAASLAGVSTADVAGPLAELVDAHLLAVRGPDRFELHDLLRDYANELVRVHDEGQRRETVERLVRHYLELAESADHRIDPHRDGHLRLLPSERREVDPFPDADRAFAWFRPERRLLVSLVDLAFDTELYPHAWQLVRALATFLDRDLHWTDWRTTSTVALRAGERLGHPAAQATALRAMSHVAVQQGHLDEAGQRLAAVLTLFEAAGDIISQAATHNSMGGVCEELGQYDAALDHARAALRLFGEVGDVTGQAHALNSVGWCEARLGRHVDALESCGDSQRRLEQLGDRFGEAVAWDSLGFIRHTMGNPAEALDCFVRAGELFRIVGERFYESVALDHLGDAHHDLDHRGEARTAWQEALAILRDLDHPMADAVRVKLAQDRDDHDG
jgi:tetratricopeptide (TPR) repeat protein